MPSKTSPNYLEARSTLPEELWETYDALVDEYAFHAENIHGRGWVSYKVLAELVRTAWRPSAGPVDEACL